jgi:transposase
MDVMEKDAAFVPLEYDIFFGLDVDKRSIAITIMDHEKEIRSLKMPNNGRMLINYIRRHFPDKRVALTYEVGPTGYGLYDQLTEVGYFCLVATPSMVPQPRGRHVKTNRLDSRALAKALRGGELTGIRVPSRLYRDLRHLTGLYKITAKQIRQFKCRIKALLLLEGIAYRRTSRTSHWSNYTLKQLEQLQCTAAIRFRLDRYLESLRFHRQQRLQILKELRSFCRTEPELTDSMKFVRSVPGVGWIVGTVLLARIADWQRLKNGREIGRAIAKSTSEHLQ